LSRPSQPRASSAFLFLAMAAAAIFALQSAHGLFPGDRPGAELGRLLCFAAAAVLLVAGSRSLLSRDGIGREALGMGFGRSHARAFAIGAALALAHLTACMVTLYAVSRFELVRGALPASSVASGGIGYLFGNAIEELLFRGYLLVVLARWLGTTWAVAVLAIPFGLFHFQGLDTTQLLKMMCTTGAMHFVYAYVFLATRSLWAAVAMHAVGNTLLHSVLGVDQPGLLALEFSNPPPAELDVPFIVFFGVTAGLALLLSRLEVTRSGASWLTGSGSPGRKSWS
jgi:hypothetical protein